MKRLLALSALSILFCLLSACSTVKMASKSSTSLTSFLGFSELPDWYVTEKYDYLDSQWIENDFGQKIHYRDVGEGPVIVMVHGELSSLHTWDKWIEALQEEYRIIAVDLPGSGLTGATHCVDRVDSTCSENLSHDYLYHTLKYFIHDLRLPSFSLVGSSYGGYLAALYALENPNKLNHLVLVSPMGYQQDVPTIMEYITAPGTDFINRIVQPSVIVSDAVQDFYGPNKKIPQDIMRRYIHLAQSEGAHSSNVEQLKLVKKLMEQGFTAKLSDLEVPTMILWGGTDAWGNPDHAKLWNDNIADSVLIKYSNLGRVPMEEDSETTAIDLNAFFKGDDIPTLVGLGGGDIFTIGDAEAMFNKEDVFGGTGESEEMMSEDQ